MKNKPSKKAAPSTKNLKQKSKVLLLEESVPKAHASPRHFERLSNFDVHTLKRSSPMMMEMRSEQEAVELEKSKSSKTLHEELNPVEEVGFEGSERPHQELFYPQAVHSTKAKAGDELEMQEVLQDSKQPYLQKHSKSVPDQDEKENPTDLEMAEANKGERDENEEGQPPRPVDQDELAKDLQGEEDCKEPSPGNDLRHQFKSEILDGTRGRVYKKQPQGNAQAMMEPESEQVGEPEADEQEGVPALEFEEGDLYENNKQKKESEFAQEEEVHDDDADAKTETVLDNSSPKLVASDFKPIKFFEEEKEQQQLMALQNDFQLVGSRNSSKQACSQTSERKEAMSFNVHNTSSLRNGNGSISLKSPLSKRKSKSGATASAIAAGGAARDSYNSLPQYSLHSYESKESQDRLIKGQLQQMGHSSISAKNEKMKQEPEKCVEEEDEDSLSQSEEEVVEQTEAQSKFVRKFTKALDKAGMAKKDLKNGDPRKSTPNQKRLTQLMRTVNRAQLTEDEKVFSKLTDDMKDRLIDEQSLSVTLLKNHIRQNHPMKTNEEYWSLGLSPGAFFSLDAKRDIPSFIRDIGLGPAIYLLTLKTLGKIFFLLAVLNLPAFYFFYSGTETESRGLSGINHFFAMFSMGNLGKQGLYCSSMNFGNVTDQLSLTCPSGTLHHLVAYGLKKENDQYCDAGSAEGNAVFFDNHGDLTEAVQNAEDEHHEHEESNAARGPKYIKNYFEFTRHCSSQISDETYEAEFTSAFSKAFDEDCRDQRNCQLGLDYSIMGTSCREEIEERAPSSQFGGLAMQLKQTAYPDIEHSFNKSVVEPELYVLYLCENSKVVMKGLGFHVSKSIIASAVVLLDVISMAVILVFINILILMQEDFAQQFDMETIEMKDFTVRIDQLPIQFRNYQDEVSMKYQLWKYIQEKIQDAKDAKLCSKDLDPTVVEINFGIRNYDILNRLKEIDDTCNEMELQNIKLYNSKYPGEARYLKEELEITRSDLMVRVNRYREMYGDTSIMKAVQNNNIGELYDQIRVIYITFLTTEAKDLIQDKILRCDTRLPKRLRVYYEEKRKKEETILMAQRRLLNIFGGPESIERKAADHQLMRNSMMKKSTKLASPRTIRNQMRIFIKRRLQEELNRIHDQIRTWQPVDPEFILWENVPFSAQQRKLRRFFSIFVALLITAFSIWLVFFFNVKKEAILKSQPSTDCGQIVPKQDAYLDALKPVEQRLELMSCYCYNLLLTDSSAFLKSDFTEFGGPDAPKFCSTWFTDYTWGNFIVYGSSMVVVTINMIAQTIFIMVAQNEKQYNSALENSSIFQLIFFQQFINIGIILTFTDQAFLKAMQFDSDWYIQIGTQICFTMVVQTFSTKGSDLFKIALHLVLRWWDRNFTSAYGKKLKDGSESDVPETQMYRQGDLQQLYTGVQIPIGYKFAQTFTFIFVCLTYSAGLPIMYFIGMTYFFITYWFNKTCLMRYYQKTKVFNEELPIESVKLFKYAIMFHFIFAGVMYSSSTILTDEKIEGSNFNEKWTPKTGVMAKLFTPHLIILLVFILITVSVYIYQIFFANPIALVIKEYVSFIQNMKRAYSKGEKDAIDVDDLSHFQIWKRMRTSQQEKAEQQQTNKISVVTELVDDPQNAESQEKLIEINRSQLGKSSTQNLQPVDIESGTKGNPKNDDSFENQPEMVDPVTKRKVRLNRKESMNVLDSQEDSIRLATNFKEVESKNLYGELLFDYLEVYYRNHKQYLEMVQAKIQELEEYPMLSGGSYINIGHLKKYRDSIKQNLRRLEKQVDHYYYFLRKEKGDCFSESSSLRSDSRRSSRYSPSDSQRGANSKFQRIQLNQIFQKNPGEVVSRNLVDGAQSAVVQGLPPIDSIGSFPAKSGLVQPPQQQNGFETINQQQQRKLHYEFNIFSIALNKGDAVDKQSNPTQYRINTESELLKTDPDHLRAAVEMSSQIQLEKIQSKEEVISQDDEQNPSADVMAQGLPPIASSFLRGNMGVGQINEIWEDDEATELEGGTAEKKKEQPAKRSSLIQSFQELGSQIHQKLSSNPRQRETDPSHHGSIAILQNGSVIERDNYLAKIDYLNDNFDEDSLQLQHFPDNFRCASFSQTYNILDNPQFNKADQALVKAQLLLQEPVLFSFDPDRVKEKEEQWQ